MTLVTEHTNTVLAMNVTAPLQRLDPYAGGLSPELPRVDALAVISCGYRAEKGEGNRPGLPKASRPTDDRQIHLHDALNRAPGLAMAISAGKHRQLTIAFPLDDPRQFIIQRFTRYSASRLEAYGDESAITWIHPAADGKEPRHQRFVAGTDEYTRLVKTCKADTRIYFCLADWTDSGPEVIFPDGLGVYAIRTTSRHSVRSILGALAYTARFTHGKIAGLPFLLSVDHREVAGPDGSKRTVPVWTITTKPPEGARLSSRTFRDIATSALREGASLMLPAPDAGTWEDAEADGPPPVDEPSDQELAQLQRGGLCDYEHWTKTWHALARGSAWDNDASRASFIEAYTDGATGSLSQFLRGASEDEAAALIASLGEAVSKARRNLRAADYSRIHGSDDEGTAFADQQPTPEPVEMVTAKRDARWAAFTAACAQAEAEGIDWPALSTPIPAAELADATDTLMQMVADKRAAASA